MKVRSMSPPTPSELVSAASEFEEAFGSLTIRKRDLFLRRQRLAHRRLKGDSIPTFRDEYLDFREREEEVRLEIMRLENRWRTQPRIYDRKRVVDCPTPNRRFRIWLMILMITSLMGYLLILLLG